MTVADFFITAVIFFGWALAAFGLWMLGRQMCLYVQRQRDRERSRYYQAPSRRPGYLPPDSFLNFRDDEEMLDTLGEIRALPEVRR